MREKPFAKFCSTCRLLNTYKKIHRFMNVIEFFAMRQWDYQQDNLLSMWNNLTDKDKDIFFFDMSQLDWDLFLQHYFRGIRQYLLHDPLETIPEALIRWNRCVYIHLPPICTIYSIIIIFFFFTLPDCIGFISV